MLLKRFFLLISIFASFFLFTRLAYASEFERRETVVVPRAQIVNSDYFAAGERVTVTGVVNGDAYVAGGTVVVDGTINGDLLVTGGNITIRGSVKNDIRAVGGSILIDGKVGGNVTVAGGNVTFADSAQLAGSVVGMVGNLQIFSPVGKDLTTLGGQVLIGNKVGGDITAAVGHLTLSDTAAVAGSLTYWSDQKATISDSASVSGKVSQQIPQRVQSEAAKNDLRGFMTGARASVRIIDLLVSFLVGLFLFRFIPVFSEDVVLRIKDRLGKSMFIGFLVFIATPFIGLVLLLTIIGIPVALLWFLALIIYSYLGKIYVSYFIGQYAATWANQKFGIPSTLGLGLIVYSLISWLPIVGGIFSLLAIFVGVGAIVWEKKATYTSLRARNVI